MTGKLIEQYELLLNHQLGIKPDIGFVKYLDLLQMAIKEYPKTSQVELPIKDGKIDWETVAKNMELKIIDFENFGKKWLIGDEE